MHADNLAEVTAVLAKATTDSLADVVVEVTTHAQDKGLGVLPASLEIDAIVGLDHEQLSAEQVVSAAASSGTSLLYLNRKVVDTDTTIAVIREAELPNDSETARRALLKQLKRITGWTSEVEIGFAHQGVMHIWAVVVPWADDLNDLARGTRQGPARWSPLDSVGSTVGENTRLDDATITELAGQLADSPDFRRASRRLERETAARHIPQLASIVDDRDGRWQVHSVIREATELLQDHVASCIDRLKPRISDLAAKLAADGQYRKVRTPEARKKFAQEWSLEHTDGLRMPVWWVTELVAAAKDAPAQLTL